MSKLIATILLAALFVPACSRFKRKEQKFDQLPPARMSSDSVGLIIGVAEIPREDFDKLEELWSQIDTQSVSLRTLKKYDRNGFRVGIAPSHLPAVFHQLVGQTRVVGLGTEQFGQQLAEQNQNLLTLQKMWNRSSETETILVSKPYERLNWDIDTREGRRTGAVEQANCCFFLNTLPRGDGSVGVRLTPGLRYGEPRSKFTVSGDEFLYQTDQEQVGMDELEFGLRLRLGESIVIGAGRIPSGLGNAFFGSNDDHPMLQRIMVIRVVQTQLDELFAPEKIRTPIATPRN